jgi:hypothetical protein
MDQFTLDPSNPEQMRAAEREAAKVSGFMQVKEAALSLQDLKRLAATGVSLDSTDARGNTNLHLSAAVAPNPDKVKNLLEAGASLEPRTVNWVRESLTGASPGPARLFQSVLELLLLHHEQRRRRAAGLCTLCGKPMSGIDRLLKRSRHSKCTSSSE